MSKCVRVSLQRTSKNMRHVTSIFEAQPPHSPNLAGAESEFTALATWAIKFCIRALEGLFFTTITMPVSVVVRGRVLQIPCAVHQNSAAQGVCMNCPGRAPSGVKRR